MVGSRRLGEGNKLSRRIKNLDSSRSIGFRPCPDSFAAGRVDMLEIPVVYELPVPILFMLAHPEVESTPGDKRGLVRQAGKVDIRLGMEFRHNKVSLFSTTEITEDTEKNILSCARGFQQQ